MAYKGVTVKLPIGAQGFSGTRNPSQAGPGHLLFVDGAELDGGIIRKEGGAVRLNTETLGGVPDPQTEFLLHCNGADASTNFPDAGDQARTFTARLNAQVDTAQSKFGGASMLLAGGDDRVDTPDHADFTIGSGDFTFDCWIRIADTGIRRQLAGQSNAAGDATSISLYVEKQANDRMRAFICVGAATIQVIGTTALVTGQFYHLAIVIASGVLKLFLNGVQEGGNVSVGGSVNDATSVWTIGRAGDLDNAAVNTWNGWVDEVRLSIGVARWTSNFTPPTAAYTNLIPPGSVVVSGINWDPVSGARHDVVFLSNGNVQQDPSGAGTFATIMTTGLTNVREPPPCFVPAGGEAVGGNRKLFMFSSPNQVQVAIGAASTMAAIGAPAADWAAGAFPTFGVLHGARMFAGGNGSDPHRIYYSTLTNHGDFTGAGSGTLAIYPGESERLVGGISFRGALILFKYPFGIYIINTSSLTPGEWSVARMTRAVGTLSQHSIVQIENDIFYMDHVGNIHSLRATQEFGDFNTSDISKVATLEPFIRNDINRSAIRRVQGAWYAAKKQAWFCLPRIGSLDNDLRLIIGLEQVDEQGQPGLPRFFMSRRDVCVSLWMRADANLIPRPTIGDNNGFIWRLDDLSRNKNGEAYPIRFETANTDLSFLEGASNPDEGRTVPRSGIGAPR